MKSLERRPTSTKKKSMKDEHITKNPFFGIQGKVVNYASQLIKYEHNKQKRKKLWLNVPEHLTGNHKGCDHSKKIKKRGRPRKKKEFKEDFDIWKAGVEIPAAKLALKKFCEKTADFIQKCEPNQSTQVNESQNSIISRQACKNISYGPSYPCRVAVAIGLRNDPENFCANVMEKTGMNEFLYQDIIDCIQKRDVVRNFRNIRRKTKYERKCITIGRRRTRKKYKSSKKGDYNDRKFEYVFDD